MVVKEAGEIARKALSRKLTPKGLAGKILFYGLVPGSVLDYVREEHRREGDHNHSEDYFVAGGLELARIGLYMYEALRIYEHFRQ